jgi:hypothetical protein
MGTTKGEQTEKTSMIDEIVSSERNVLSQTD